MSTTHSLKRVLAGALMSLCLATAGLGLATGTALAHPSGPHQWCPGDSMYYPPGPGAVFVWDMNVCHTWKYVRSGMGNVPVGLSGNPAVENSNLWDGPNPPPGSLIDCGIGLFGGAIRC